MRLETGEIITVTVDVPPGSTLADVQLPGELVTGPAAPAVPGQQPPETAPAPAPEQAPHSGGGVAQERTGSGERVRREPERKRKLTGGVEAEPEPDNSGEPAAGAGRSSATPTAPRPCQPGPDRCPAGPLDGDRGAELHHPEVPRPDLPAPDLPGGRHPVRRPLGGAGGDQRDRDRLRPQPERLLGRRGRLDAVPPLARGAYGVDANKDGRKDPYNPVDAIFAAARYLDAAGYEQDVRRAIFAYNHADWYVDSVLLRARLIAGVPGDLAGSLTGLTEGRFPVYAAPATPTTWRSANSPSVVARGENAAHLVESSDDRRGVEIYARPRPPVVAVNDGQIRRSARTSGSATTWCSRTSTATASPTAASRSVAVPTRCRRRMRSSARRGR